MLFTANDNVGTTSLSATGVDCSKATVTLTEIAPTGIADLRRPDTPLRHTHGVPNIGALLDVYFQPDTVSFSRLKWREKDVACICTGYYGALNGVGHRPSKDPIQIGPDVPGLGSKLMGWDQAYSGYTSRTPPYPDGTELFNIPNQYVAIGGATVIFTTTHQAVVLSLEDNRKSATSLLLSKAGAAVTAHVDDPTTTY